YGKKTDEIYDWLLNETDLPGVGRTYYNNDFALIGNCLPPFLLRGGAWWGTGDSGVFAANSLSGNASSNIGFRPILIVQ
ncbi:MAG: hypothetical protein RSD14_06115, partial [Clostridia bacterium]